MILKSKFPQRQFYNGILFLKDAYSNLLNIEIKNIIEQIG